MKYVQLCILLMISLLSCSSASDTPKSETIVEHVVPQSVGLITKWVKEKLPNYCKQIDVPLPPKIELKSTQGFITHWDGFGGFGYVAGLYHPLDDRITIWIDNPLGEEIPFEALRDTILHELLHYHDDIKDLPVSPMDHDAIFNKRMRDLGWIK